MSKTPDYNDDYKAYEVTEQDISMISKIIALYDRTQIKDPNSRVFGETENMSDTAKKDIATATRDFLSACKDIATQQRIETYTKEEKVIDQEATLGSIREALNNGDTAKAAELQDELKQTMEQTENSFEQARYLEEFNGKPELSHIEKSQETEDHTASLNQQAMVAIRNYTRALKESGAFSAMVIGVDGIERGSTGQLSDQWAEENKLSHSEAMDNVYTGRTTLFGRDGLPDKPPEQGTPYPAYNIAIGITKAFAEQNMRTLKKEIDSMKERPKAVQMLFEREASSTFTQSAWDLQHIARGQTENAQPDQVDAGPSL